VWGEGRGEKKLSGNVLRVLVGGQAAGAVWRDGAAWTAQSYRVAPSLTQPRQASHPSADEAVRAVARSGWARRLGARAASDLYWSDKARRVVSRGGAR
jgi:hypothetical protein